MSYSLNSNVKLAARITAVAQEMAQGLHRTKREDSEQSDLDTPEYFAVAPPNPRCLSTRGGENECRCVFVYEFAPPTEEQ
jgi:hypothetical protein